MMGDDKKKFSELVLSERDKGNVVYLGVSEVLSSPVKDIIKQPADGLLWDLNRDEATALTFMDREGMSHWVNNFAVALVIRELKSQVAQLEEELEDHATYYRKIVNGECALDELHCACVPALRDKIKKQETEIETLKKEAAPFQAQIDQRKTYKTHDDVE